MSLTFEDDDVEQNHERAIERATEDTDFNTWIDGEMGAAVSGETFSPHDPTVDVPITSVARGARADVDAAVEAARDGYESNWGEATASERASMLRSWFERLRDNVDELALLETLEVGKPLSAAHADIEKGLRFFEYYADVSRAQEGEQIPTGPDTHTYVRHEPFGVAGQILPWNYPVLLMGWKVGAALAAGNTAVVKPAEQAPLAVIRAAQLSADVLPDGVLNVVPGFGTEAGTALTVHAGVDKLSFTGSVTTGRAVMQAAADSVTPVTLELGGKNPFVVFPDADLEEVARTAAVAGMYNAGQSCDAASRLVVHADVVDEFLERYLAEIDDYVLGDPLREETTMGPMCFAGQREKVAEYVSVGVEEGARIERGGDHPDSPTSDLFFEPTLFVDVDSEMRIATEEIFGPVQTLQTFESYDEAVEIANATEYGLTAGVATSDASTAHRIAADLEAGSVWINTYFGTVPGTPFGGFNSSGVGRECAQDTLREYTRSKAVNMAIDDSPW